MKPKERYEIYEILKESRFSFEKFSILMNLHGYGEKEIFNTLYHYSPWTIIMNMLYEANEKGLVPESFMKSVEKTKPENLI